PAEVRAVRQVARVGGWAMVVDGLRDGGEAYRRAAAMLTGLGVPEARTRRVPAPVRERRIDALLRDEAVTEWLNRPAMLERLAADRAVVVRGHRFGAVADLPGVGTAASRRPDAHALKLFEVELRRGVDRRTELLLA